MSRLARLAINHPWPLLAIWLALLVASLAFGRASGDSLHTADLQIAGTPADKAIKLSNEKFGGTIAMAVLLRDTEKNGKRIDRVGPKLVDELQKIEGVRVLSPWGPGGTRTLREPNGQALLALQVLRPFEQISNETTPEVRATLDRYVKPPLRADLVGSAPTSREINDSILKSLRKGELLALIFLIPLLLIVFRSVVAALIPAISGVLAIVLGEALIKLANEFTPVDAIALNILTILGLALGVDYSLLIVSRFREELAAGKTVPEAVEIATVRAGRTVMFAGITLVIGILTALFILPGGVLISGTLGVLGAAVIAVLIALFALPAELAVLGRNVNRLAIGRPNPGTPFVATAMRLIQKPGVAALAVAIPMALLSTPAIALNSQPPSFDQLPSNNRLRLGAEDFERNRPGGWIGPFEVTFNTKGPVTSAKRLRALNRFQDQLIHTKGVDAVLGPSGLLRYSKQLKKLTDQLTAGDAQADQLIVALRKILRATGQLSDGLHAGANGSEQLVNGLEQAKTGTSTLNAGVQAAQPGTQQLATGIDKADEGAGQAASGAKTLSKRAEELKKDVIAVRDALAPVPADVDQAITLNDEAVRALQASAAASDPDVVNAIAKLQAQSTLLTTQIKPAVESANSDIVQAVPVARKVASGSAELADGLGELDTGLGKASSGAYQLADGVSQLATGTSALDNGMSLLLNGPNGNDGAIALSDGLNTAASGTDELGRGVAKLLEGIVRVREVNNDKQDQLARNGTSLKRTVRSGYLMLAGIDGSKPPTSTNASFVLNTERGGDTVRVMVVPTANPFSKEAYALRGKIEKMADKTAKEIDATALVGGLPVLGNDFEQSTRGRIPFLVLALTLITFIVLVLMFRSPLLAAFAVALNLLTVGAAIGVLIICFQGDSPLLGGPGYLDVLSLSAVFVIMFGLSIDYEVFLISRLLEGRRLTGTTDGAIRHALEKTATIITGAAAIMAGVFLAFALSPVATTSQLGVGLTVAVVLDATVVRLILFPALIRLFGERTWNVPPRLDRILPRINSH